MLYRPRIGKEFSIETLKHESVWLNEVRKTYITIAVIVVSILFLGGAAILGLFTGDFEYLEDLWMAVALPIGWVARSHFADKSQPDRDRSG